MGASHSNSVSPTQDIKKNTAGQKTLHNIFEASENPISQLDQLVESDNRREYEISLELRAVYNGEDILSFIKKYGLREQGIKRMLMKMTNTQRNQTIRNIQTYIKFKDPQGSVIFKGKSLIKALKQFVKEKDSSSSSYLSVEESAKDPINQARQHSNTKLTEELVPQGRIQEVEDPTSPNKLLKRTEIIREDQAGPPNDPDKSEGKCCQILTCKCKKYSLIRKISKVGNREITKINTCVMLYLAATYGDNIPYLIITALFINLILYRIRKNMCHRKKKK